MARTDMPANYKQRNKVSSCGQGQQAAQGLVEDGAVAQKTEKILRAEEAFLDPRMGIYRVEAREINHRWLTPTTAQARSYGLSTIRRVGFFEAGSIVTLLHCCGILSICVNHLSTVCINAARRGQRLLPMPNVSFSAPNGALSA
jgi:hypothetical protein